MYEEDFPMRLAKLRTKKGVSARDMSLSIGQNPGYINNIETGKALPSMSTFFYICEYLKVTPEEFFRQDRKNPILLNEVISELKDLSPEQLKIVQDIIADIKRLNK